LQREIHDARVFMINLPTIRGLGQFGGFDFYLEDRSGLGRPALADAQRQSSRRPAPILS